jgi:hypothetical protein
MSSRECRKVAWTNAGFVPSAMRKEAKEWRNVWKPNLLISVPSISKVRPSGSTLITTPHDRRNPRAPTRDRANLDVIERVNFHNEKSGFCTLSNENKILVSKCLMD